MSMREIAGVRKMLDRLESRSTAHWEVLKQWALGHEPHRVETTAVTDGETETLENAIIGLSGKLLGAEPPNTMWESIDTYAKRNYDRKEGWAANEAEYISWFLMGIQKTRMFI